MYSALFRHKFPFKDSSELYSYNFMNYSYIFMIITYQNNEGNIYNNDLSVTSGITEKYGFIFKTLLMEIWITYQKF